MKKKYEVRCYGDIDDWGFFNSLEDALIYLKTNYGYTDPEDNRMVIREITYDGLSKVVWHFSGWHWDADEFDLPQGHYLGEADSVYEMSNQA